MRLALSLTLSLAAAAGCAALAPAPVARAQTMDCYGVQGGRPVCTPSREALFDAIDRQARANRAASTRERKLVRAVAQAIHDGHCEEALALALKADDPMVAANTARLCGVPEAPPPEAQRRPAS